MKCTKCDKEIENGSVYCKFCGTNLEQQNVQQVNTQSTKQITNGNQANIYAMIGFGFSFFSSIVGLIISTIALCKFKQQQNQDYKAMAVSGIIVSGVYIFLTISGIILSVIATIIVTVLSTVVPVIIAGVLSSIGI